MQLKDDQEASFIKMNELWLNYALSIAARPLKLEAMITDESSDMMITDESSDMMIPDETREYVMELGQTLEDWDRTRRMHEDSTEIFDENAYHISSISLLIERLLQVFWALRGSVEESPALGPVVKEEIVREAIRPVAEHLSTHSEVGVDEWTTDMTPLFNAIALMKWYNEREQTLPNEISNEREQTLRNEISALVVKNVKEMAMLCVGRLYPH